MELELLTRPAEEKNSDSPPILFVHGAWHGAWSWAEYFLPYFAAAGYDTYALSLRGHGESAGSGRLRWSRMSGYVADVAQIVAGLPQLPVLVGHSMGGCVVQKYLESYAAPAAVLMASVPPRGALGATWRIARRLPREFLRTNLTLSLYPLVGTPELAQDMLFSATMPAEQVAVYFEKIQDESYLAFLDMLGLNLPRPKRLNTPLLVLGGEDDRIFSVKEVQATAAAYQTKAIIFPHMAHDMLIEAGWQDVADCIRDWLAGRDL